MACRPIERVREMIVFGLLAAKVKFTAPRLGNWKINFSVPDSEPAMVASVDFYDLRQLPDDISIATASHMSARFPYVSPSGYLPPSRNGPPAYIVDGGYYDNSGASANLDILATRALTSKLQDGRAVVDGLGPVEAYYIHIDNGYGGQGLTGSRNYSPTEFTIPIKTFYMTMDFNVQDATERVRRVFKNRFCQITVPDSPMRAPLGWVLSEKVMSVLDNQLTPGIRQGCSGQPWLRPASEQDGKGASAFDQSYAVQ